MAVCGSFSWNSPLGMHKYFSWLGLLNNMCNIVLNQTRKEIKTKSKSLLHMIWAGRSDHLEGDITPIAGMNLSSVVYLRVLLVWYSI